jgi:hypothetical protein
MVRLISKGIIRAGLIRLQTRAAVLALTLDKEPTTVETLRRLWEEGRSADPDYEALIAAVKEGKRVFPASLGVKVSIADCQTATDGTLLFRERRWVPNYEPLRTALI